MQKNVAPLQLVNARLSLPFCVVFVLVSRFCYLPQQRYCRAADSLQCFSLLSPSRLHCHCSRHESFCGRPLRAAPPVFVQVQACAPIHEAPHCTVSGTCCFVARCFVPKRAEPFRHLNDLTHTCVLPQVSPTALRVSGLPLSRAGIRSSVATAGPAPSGAAPVCVLSSRFDACVSGCQTPHDRIRISPSTQAHRPAYLPSPTFVKRHTFPHSLPFPRTTNQFAPFRTYKCSAFERRHVH